MGLKHGDGTRGHARAHGVRARSENDRHARAEHNAGRVRLGKECEILGEHVARLEIGHHENLRVPGDCGFDAFDLGRLRANGIIESKRPVENPAGDLATLGHLAERRGVDALVRGLRDLGYIEGRNMILEHRFPNEELTDLGAWPPNL
jgi:hypothetical protein